MYRVSLVHMWFVERGTRYDVHTLGEYSVDGGLWAIAMSPEMSEYKDVLRIKPALTWTRRWVRHWSVPDCGIESTCRLAAGQTQSIWVGLGGALHQKGAGYEDVCHTITLLMPELARLHATAAPLHQLVAPRTNTTTIASLTTVL
jgi:hypothetical protein